jgi:hypothetical protein
MQKRWASLFDRQILLPDGGKEEQLSAFNCDRRSSAIASEGSRAPIGFDLLGSKDHPSALLSRVHDVDLDLVSTSQTTRLQETISIKSNGFIFRVPTGTCNHRFL